MNEHHPHDDTPPPLPNIFVRMAMVVFQPNALFQALAARPSWFPMLALVSVAFGVAALLIPGEAYLETMRQGSPEAAQAMGSLGASVIKFLIAAGHTVWIFALMLIFAGITYVGLVFIRGDEAKFRQHLSILAHSGVVGALGEWFMLPFRSRSMDPSMLFSVGTFMPFVPDGYLASVLGFMGVFAIWTAVVAGLGLSLLDSKGWTPTAIFTVVVMVVIPSLLMGLPTLFG